MTYSVYDTRTDTLYVTYKQAIADYAKEHEDGNIFRYADGEIIGMTILDYTEKLIESFKELSETGRKNILNILTAAFCQYCGSDNPHCQCRNDE